MDKDMLVNLIIWSVINKLNYMVLNKKKKKKVRKRNYRVLRKRAPPVIDQASLRLATSLVGWALFNWPNASDAADF